MLDLSFQMLLILILKQIELLGIKCFPFGPVRPHRSPLEQCLDISSQTIQVLRLDFSLICKEEAIELEVAAPLIIEFGL